MSTHQEDKITVVGTALHNGNEITVTLEEGLGGVVRQIRLSYKRHPTYTTTIETDWLAGEMGEVVIEDDRVYGKDFKPAASRRETPEDATLYFRQLDEAFAIEMDFNANLKMAVDCAENLTEFMMNQGPALIAEFERLQQVEAKFLENSLPPAT